MLQRIALCDSSLPALWIGTQAISYGELSLQINQTASRLSRLGIRTGHRVAFIADTHISSIILFLALLEIKASPCLLSTRLPQKQIPLSLQKAQASFFLEPSSLAPQKLRTESLQNPEEILLFTSGSSGLPKLAVLTPQHFFENTLGAIEKLGLNQPNSCWLLSVPLFHVSGLSILFRCLLTANAVVLPSDPLLEKITHLSWVPTQLFRHLDTKIKFPQLRCALLGGAPISPHLLQKALLANIPLFLTYGMTEMASQITMTNATDQLIPLHLGKPLPGREVQISPEGEILVRGSCLFTGYDTEEGIKKTLINGNWFATGDLGEWDLNGNLQHKGRKDHLFISGGENIHPATIESALETLPNVLLAIVVAQEDPEFGHRPVAFLHMQSKMPSREEFQEKLTPLLPKFCIPVRFLPIPIEEFSKSFKLIRSSLQQKLQKKEP